MKRRPPPTHPRKILVLERLRRWIRYRLIIPVFRSPHSPEHTARGVANGVFWGLTPIIGLQTAAITATWLVARKLLRKDSSLIQAFIWVWVNNPVTVVPMYYVFYVTGQWLGGHAADATGYDAFVELLQTTEGTWLTRATTLMAAIGAPLLIGCLPYALLGGLMSYTWARAVVVRRRQRRARAGLWASGAEGDV